MTPGMFFSAPKRAWCAVYQWPDRKPFLFGTAFVRANAPLQEVDAELRKEFARMWGEILPAGVPLPELKDLRPGQLWFAADEQAEAA